MFSSLLIVSKKGNTHGSLRLNVMTNSLEWLFFDLFLFRFLNLSPAKRTLSYLAKNPSTTSYKWFAIIIFPFPRRFRTFFFKFVTAHAFCLELAHCAGDTYSVPHVWLDRTDYTYKFAFYYNIITSHVSLLLTSWHHPSLAYFRPLPKASDDTRASFSDISDFQFNGTSLTFGKPSPPIRRLERQ